MGLYLLRDSENLLSLKRFSKQNIIRLGMETYVLKKENLMKSMDFFNLCAMGTMHYGLSEPRQYPAE